MCLKKSLAVSSAEMYLNASAEVTYLENLSIIVIIFAISPTLDIFEMKSNEMFSQGLDGIGSDACNALTCLASR